MAESSSGPKWPKCSLLVPGHKVKNVFEISWFHWIHLKILEKMRPCLWKLELGFSNNGLISLLPKALGPNCPKLVFRLQTPNVRALGSKSFFMSCSIKFCIKWALIFNFWIFFDKVLVVIRRKLQKAVNLGAISDM